VNGNVDGMMRRLHNEGMTGTHLHATCGAPQLVVCEAKRVAGRHERAMNLETQAGRGRIA
jgi:hypothetical protein